MKLLIVTGGSRGLGKALLEQYSENDKWHIVELSRSGKSKHNVSCDLANVESTGALGASLFTELAGNEWEEIVYINNAADLFPISSVGSLKQDDIVRNISLNQISVFILMSAFITVFRTHQGRKSIVNISSGAALKGYAGWSLYCASKAACENFVNAAAAEEEFQDFPFIVVNYGPNVMDTTMQVAIRESDKSHFPAKELFVDLKDNGNLLTPESVASDLIKKIAKGMKNNTRYSV